MTDTEIIKALECLFGRVDCRECPYSPRYEFPLCQRKVAKDTRDLINRIQARVEKCEKAEHFADKTIATLRAEIERLLDYNENLQTANTALSNEILEIKSEAIKEFAKRLKDNYCFTDRWGKIIPISTVDTLVKEMTEVETNQRKEDEGK